MDSPISTKTGMTSRFISLSSSGGAVSSIQSLNGETDTPTVGQTDASHRAIGIEANTGLVDNPSTCKTTEEVATLSSLSGVAREISARTVSSVACMDNRGSLVDPRSI